MNSLSNTDYNNILFLIILSTFINIITIIWIILLIKKTKNLLNTINNINTNSIINILLNAIKVVIYIVCSTYHLIILLNTTNKYIWNIHNITYIITAILYSILGYLETYETSYILNNINNYLNNVISPIDYLYNNITLLLYIYIVTFIIEIISIII